MIYKIKMNKDDYFKISNKIISSNLIINDNDVIFEIEGGSYNILKRTNYEYKIIESLSSKLLRFLTNYGLLIYGILFLFSILYMNNYRIEKIEFNRQTPINDDIEYKIKSSYKKLLFFNFCNINFNKFSIDIQKKYFEYPYINVYKKNNNIFVYIADMDEINMNIEEIKEGNIIAKKDGIVDLFYVYNGKNKVSKNKYVKKGDILIEGNTKSRGLILATTYDKLNICISKKINTYEVTKEYQNYYNVSLFNLNFNIGKKQDYVYLNSCENLLFNLFDFFSLKKIEETKKNAIIKEYDSTSALEEAKKNIELDFSNHQNNSLEKIVSMVNIKTVEDNDNYYFTFIVKKYESIGIYEE